MASLRETPLEGSFCEYVAESEAAFAVENDERGPARVSAQQPFQTLDLPEAGAHDAAGRFGIDLAAASVEVTAVDDAALRDLIERSSVVLGF